MGSYPLLVGIPANMPLGRFIDATVTRHGHRSITGVSYPLDINTASIPLIQELPGIGKKQAADIKRKAPFTNKDDFIKRIGSEEILPYIKI